VPPDPTRVWLVREGDPDAIEGTLALEGGSLTFVPEGRDQETVAIPVRGIRKARRRRGTPVLTLSYPRPDGMGSLFVYFAKPPPLPGERRDAAAGVPGVLAPRGLERSAAALTMRQTNKLLKEEIEGWVRALRAAGAAP
jgi:hypothetical protein